jgi:Domain of unknown function (DUF4394)/PEP-CTERM motif
MNLRNIQKTAKASVVAVALGVGIVACGSAKAETLTALVFQGNQIFAVNSSNPGTIVTSVGVSGLQGGDILVGIDYLGSTLYAIGSAGNLYTVNGTTGAATLDNHFGPLDGIYFGMDASAAGIRVVSDADINLLLNPVTGAIISSTPSLTPTPLDINAIASSGSAMYAVDSEANTLGILNTVTGTFATIGSMGYDVSAKNGFDISGATGTAYFASAVSSSGVDPNLYTVNLATGFASLVGQIGPGEGTLIAGLTVTPVPEPATTTLALIGGAGMIALLRRRK